MLTYHLGPCSIMSASSMFHCFHSILCHCAIVPMLKVFVSVRRLFCVRVLLMCQSVCVQECLRVWAVFVLYLCSTVHMRKCVFESTIDTKTHLNLRSRLFVFRPRRCFIVSIIYYCAFLILCLCSIESGVNKAIPATFIDMAHTQF